MCCKNLKDCLLIVLKVRPRPELFLELDACLLKPLFLHGSRCHSHTPISISHSYETVASMLGPSSSALSEADHEPKTISYKDLMEKRVSPSDEFFLHFGDNTTQTDRFGSQTEGQIEDSHNKQTVEYPTSVEPYMWNLVGGRSVTPSPSTDSDDGFLVCASMKKWPPLTEADITEISKEEGEQVEEQEATLDEWNKERSHTGQDTAHAESLLASDKTGAEQDEVRNVSSSLQLDKG